MKPVKDIDEYIKTYPKNVGRILENMRQTIQKAAPEAVEAISYQMPTFKLYGKNLVHFAAFARHIGFYPIPSAIEAFKKELSKYKGGKGSVQFPIEQPIPYSLVANIVTFRAKEVQKETAKTCSRAHTYQGSGPCPVCWPGRKGKNSK